MRKKSLVYLISSQQHEKITAPKTTLLMFVIVLSDNYLMEKKFSLLFSLLNVFLIFLSTASLGHFDLFCSKD